jgi:hypothetical protein
MTMHLRRHTPLPPRSVFIRRLARNILIAAGLIASSLVLGMCGYHGLEGLTWLDSFLNASMILAGMGPVGELHTSGGKLFAGCYAIFSGVVFLTMAAVLFAPVVHRFLHRMHLEIDPEAGPEPEPASPPANRKEQS